MLFYSRPEIGFWKGSFLLDKTLKLPEVQARLFIKKLPTYENVKWSVLTYE